MPLWIFPVLIAFSTLAALGAGIWLLLHLQAVADLFRGRADLIAAPKRPRASRRSVRLALAIFVIGSLLSLAIFVLAMTGAANAVAA